MKRKESYPERSCSASQRTRALAIISHALQEVSRGRSNTGIAIFDEVNHDRLMYRLSERIGDKILLRLIRKYLQSGIMTDGVMSQRTKGTPQGSPLSPLLSNIVLDELDKELEGRGHKFVRYADDCNIFVRSQAAGERVMQSISNFIEGKLKLIVNKTKSKVCYSNQTKFLGYTVQNGGYLTIANNSLERLKEKVRKITKRNRGCSFMQADLRSTKVFGEYGCN
jgi:RNA-directed DNA polymerase